MDKDKDLPVAQRQAQPSETLFTLFNLSPAVELSRTEEEEPKKASYIKFLNRFSEFQVQGDRRGTGVDLVPASKATEAAL